MFRNEITITGELSTVHDFNPTCQEGIDSEISRFADDSNFFSEVKCQEDGDEFQDFINLTGLKNVNIKGNVIAIASYPCPFPFNSLSLEAELDYFVLIIQSLKFFAAAVLTLLDDIHFVSDYFSPVPLGIFLGLSQISKHCEGVDKFWQVLVNGKNCTVEIPTERFNTEVWYDPDDNKPGKMRTKKAALTEGFNEFDNKLFGISDPEADRLDPQHKSLLECTYRALEDAGIPTEEVAGSRVGVFIGLMNRDYEFMASQTATLANHYNATGTAMSIAANRISYVFNLTGPSLVIDTACSSSLVALHYACLAIKQDYFRGRISE
ncbi:phenolphthiocerol/phthiocerol polyketide synthase subunit B-like [Tachyglossus aculeatus]|uniref:phenolphthiocerol/phthiocerol polyketide synthase subunit B-like n=1 Tax=Tachyglossus aculeatus TaxID=9261 RepID=UPI0018F44690|nr:phenolphthiocerol/phthiocerol polyketide synthase subunit B-like [Tachyglossus aculeatus]